MTDSSKPAPPGTVLLVHGPCLRKMRWKPWIGRYTARGYTVVSTVVPSAETGRACHEWNKSTRDEAAAVAVVDYYERLVQSMPGPVLLVGHCFGGLVVQMLLERGLGTAGAAISTPPLPGRLWLTRLAPVHAGGNATTGMRVDYRRADRAPLLLVGGGLDVRIPAAWVERVARRYEEGGALVGHLEYPDLCHNSLSGPDWQGLADDILDWMRLQSEPTAPARFPRREWL